MKINPRNRTAVRTLIAFAALLAVIFGGIAAASAWGSPRAEWTPQLGLDLAGGRQIVIEPILEEGGSVTGEQVDQAIDIIRNRIDGQGTAEAEVSRLGGNNIVVSIPGNPTAAQMEALSRSSQLRFRTVLVSQPTGQIPGQPSGPVRNLPLPVEPLEPLEPEAPEDGADEEGQELQPEEPGDEETSEGAYPEGLTMAATQAAAVAGAAVSEAVVAGESDNGEAEQTEEPEPAPPAPTGLDASDLNWITPDLQAEFDTLDCTDPEVARTTAQADPALPVVACSVGGLEKFILGPSELSGAQIVDASSGLEMGQAGPTGRIEVRLSLNDEGRDAFREVTRRAFSYPSGSAQNRFAMVLDGQVISAPGVNAVIADGSASISGGFTSESAETLANQLKFGALPMSFTIQTSEQVSPTLGGEQLRLGLIAGAIGLLLVFVFMLIQYRALGLVTVATLILAAILTYGAVTLLGWSNNLRLTMAGVTGLLLAIGIIADSFIVYFERIKDEVRAGRPLRYAVDTGWQRARRTILISDGVNLIAAAVLYLLSESSVRAFAFALGLITIIDLIVVFMFTHPVVSILANGTFFGQGHKWSGMDPERLGAKRSTYLGRGQFRMPEPVRKPRHTREELEGGVV